MRLLVVPNGRAGLIGLMADRSRSHGRHPIHPRPSSPPRSEATDPPTEKGQPKAAVEQPVAVLAPATAINQLARRTAQARGAPLLAQEYVLAKAQAFISAFALVFAGAAFVASYGALRETRRQADIAQDALITIDRPWLKVIGLENTPIDVRAGYAWTFANIEVKNIGRSPAQHTLPTFLLFLTVPSTSRIPKRQTSVERLRAQGTGQKTNSCSPTTPDISGTSAVALSAVKDKRDRRAEREYVIARRMIGRHGQRPVDRSPEPPCNATFTLVGCVTYAIATRQALGQTAFIYDLSYACGLGRLGQSQFRLSHPGSYSGNDVGVREPASGSFAR